MSRLNHWLGDFRFFGLGQFILIQMILYIYMCFFLLFQSFHYFTPIYYQSFICLLPPPPSLARSLPLSLAPSLARSLSLSFSPSLSLPLSLFPLFLSPLSLSSLSLLYMYKYLFSLSHFSFLTHTLFAPSSHTQFTYTLTHSLLSLYIPPSVIFTPAPSSSRSFYIKSPSLR